MTIKEIETRSCLTRANIRFYEAEGLLAPTRLDNGYRDYSEADLDALMRIRLLRALGVPLEDIRALQSGGCSLSDTLEKRLDAMTREQSDLSHAQEVCRTLCANSTSYETLDARRWLDALDSTPAVPSSDAIREPRAPWRRFFARSLDLLICSVLIYALFLLVFHVNLTNASFLQKLLIWVLNIALTLIFEPLLLSWFGTTPGKWILGLRVTDLSGQRLSRSDAWERTTSVLLLGLGFLIPVVSWICMFLNLRRCEKDEPLPWENNSAVTASTWKGWRAAAYILACIVVFGAAALTGLAVQCMPNRGDLTVSEFIENYNHASELHDPRAEYLLDDDGSWQKRAEYDIILFDAPPALVFEEQNGYVTGVSFSADAEIRSYAGIESCIVYALAGAQKGQGAIISLLQADRIVSYLQDKPFQDMAFDVCGVHIEIHAELYETSVAEPVYGSSGEPAATEEAERTFMRVDFSAFIN